MTTLPLILLIVAFIFFTVDAIQTRSLIATGLAFAALAVVLQRGMAF